MIRQMLVRPGAVGSFGGDLAEQVILSFTKSLGGKNVAFRGDMRRKLELLRAELLGDKPTSIERVLVERVVACWLQVQDTELRPAQLADPTFKQPVPDAPHTPGAPWSLPESEIGTC